MKKSLLEKLVENGISFLSEFFPKASTLYVPLLSASIVWAIKRAAEWKEKILSWKVWADPGYIETKPNEFVLEFFKSHPALSQSYQDEIQKGDMESLREAFSCLYPILGLEDPFLTALFAHELESENYRKMVKEFRERVEKAKENIEEANEERLLRGLKTFADDAVSLGVELLSQAKLRKVIADLVKESLKKDKKE